MLLPNFSAVNWLSGARLSTIRAQRSIDIDEIK
jgi:hypothetical protein